MSKNPIISDNCLIGAVNAFGEATNKVKNQIDGSYGPVPATARAYKAASIPLLVMVLFNSFCRVFNSLFVAFCPTSRILTSSTCATSENEVFSLQEKKKMKHNNSSSPFLLLDNILLLLSFLEEFLKESGERNPSINIIIVKSI